MHNDVDELLRDKDSQVLSKKKLHTESSYALINSLSLMKQHAFKIMYVLSVK